MMAHLSVLTTKHKIYSSLHQSVHTSYLSDLSNGVQDAFLQQFTFVTKVMFTVLTSKLDAASHHSVIFLVSVLIVNPLN